MRRVVAFLLVAATAAGAGAQAAGGSEGVAVAGPDGASVAGTGAAPVADADATASGEGAQAELAASTAVLAAHRRADLIGGEDPLAAARELEAVLRLDFPAGETSRLLRADIFARLAELYLSGGEAEAAKGAVELGLAEQQGEPESALGAQLKLRQGEVLEVLGDEKGALDAYGEAIEIAKRLLAARRQGGTP